MNGSSQRRYRILHAVGKGAFGTVYRAQMLGEGGFHKDVAIKLMNAEVVMPDQVAQRQRDEARLLGLIRHRAILQVDGLVRLNGAWAVVMEYIDGVNLRELVRHGPVPPSCSLQIVGEVAGALHVAWEAQAPDGTALRIIHRDIKPANIQLTRAGEVKLLDFGVARAEFGTRESETVGVILGTLRYMAPERLDGIDGPEGDVYALGVVLVELLTRKPMVKTSSNPDRHAETVEQAIARVVEAIGETHRDVVKLLEDCLAYAPESRPTARQLERRAWTIAQAYPLPRLQEWAEVRVGEAQQHVRDSMDADELSGATLMEQSESMMMGRSDPPPPTEAPARRGVDMGRGLIGFSIAGLVLMATLGAATVLLVLFLILSLERPRPTVRPPSAPAITEHDAGANRYPVVYRERDGREVTEAPRPLAELLQPRPIPAPEPEPVSTGTVEVLGEVGAVAMVGPPGTFQVPGDVPVGTYTVVFAGVAALKNVHVPAGGRVTIACDAAFTICNLR